uniref:G-protein coupled receptors family 1 profile domain-containing protein n=1 Tax=Gadus morhua TaxID=8049 RepID=A0A8C5C6H5_GADMO
MLSVLLLLCVAGGTWAHRPDQDRLQRGQGPAGPTLCPAPCHCEEDGIYVIVDCSELGLSSVPENLSPFTSYLICNDNKENYILFYSTTHTHAIKTNKSNKTKQVAALPIQDLPCPLQHVVAPPPPRRLDANLLSEVPAGAFRGVGSLRHLWLDDNSLTEIPVAALDSLPSLQAMTLALNRITHIPDHAFTNLSALVVLHIHNNQIQSLGERCFEGLQSLETLDLNYNDLQEFPVAIRTLTKLQELGFHNNKIRSIPERAFVGNPQLQTIHFYENPIQFVGKSAFQFLPKLHTLSLNGATQIQQFPDLKGTTSLEILTLTRAGLSALPQDLCEQLPRLRVLDLTENRLSSVPVGGLVGLTHLKLRGNTNLYEAFSPEYFPRMRVIEMPYAYQCCVYGSCDSYKSAAQWDTEQGIGDDDPHKRTIALYPSHTDTHYDPDLEEFQLEIEESKLQTSVQCTPNPGPFRPCDSLLGSWLVRVGLWAISFVSVLGNFMLLLSLFGSAGYLSPLRFTVACMGASNLLTGVCTCTLALVDALTFGEFGHHGARWEGGPGCQATGWVWVFSSEASVLLLTLAAVQCGVSVTCVRAYGKSPSLGSVRACSLFCLTLSLTLASLPLVGVGEYGSSPFCLPSPLPPSSSQPHSSIGFPLALIMMNTLCLLIVTGSYIRLYWELLRGECEGLWDCAMIKHVAWLIFTNGLLYVPVAILSLFSLLGLLSLGQEVLKSVLLLLQPLPSCLNPLLFLLFTRDSSQFFFFWPRPKACPQLRRDHPHDSLMSVETEKSSCSESSAQLSLNESDGLYSDGPAPTRSNPIRFSNCSSTSSSVPLIPCQIPSPRPIDRVTERLSLGNDGRLKSFDGGEGSHTCSFHPSSMPPSIASPP